MPDQIIGVGQESLGQVQGTRFAFVVEALQTRGARAAPVQVAGLPSPFEGQYTLQLTGRGEACGKIEEHVRTPRIDCFEIKGLVSCFDDSSGRVWHAALCFHVRRELGQHLCGEAEDARRSGQHQEAAKVRRFELRDCSVDDPSVGQCNLVCKVAPICSAQTQVYEGARIPRCAERFLYPKGDLSAHADEPGGLGLLKPEALDYGRSHLPDNTFAEYLMFVTIHRHGVDFLRTVSKRISNLKFGISDSCLPRLVGRGSVAYLPLPGVADDIFEVLVEGDGAPAGKVLVAGLVVEVPLAGDVGVLKVVGPPAELAGAVLDTGYEIGDLGFEMLGAGAAVHEAEHGAKLAGGAAGNVEERDQFVR